MTAALLTAGTVAGCQNDASDSFHPPVVAGADATHGAQLVRVYGCGSCHAVPGIPGASGVVGPPLTQFARRVYVAGMVRNSPDNLMAWLMDPQSIVPGNAMPSLGVTRTDARDMAAYLYTLE